MWFALWIGCAVVDAPEALEDLMVYGFVHTADEDPRPLEVAAADLPEQVNRYADALREGYSVSSLTRDDLAVVGLTVDREIDVVGVAYLLEQSATVDEIASVLVGGDLSQVFDKTLEYQLHRQDDLDCFLAHACETYTNAGTRVTDAGLFGTATQDFESHVRWVEMEDGSAGLVVRQLSPDATEISSGLAAVHQSYNWALMYREGATTRRMEAYWADAEVVGLDVPETFALDLAVSSNVERAAELDAYLGYGTTTP
jgi:hypothetical protein